MRRSKKILKEEDILNKTVPTPGTLALLLIILFNAKSSIGGGANAPLKNRGYHLK